MKAVKVGQIRRKDFEIEGEKCLRDYYPENDVEKDNPIKAAFCVQVAIVQKVGRSVGLLDSETLQMIAKNYGWTWVDIPYGRFDEAKTWVANNANNYMRLIHPEELDVDVQTKMDFVKEAPRG